MGTMAGVGLGLDSAPPGSAAGKRLYWAVLGWAGLEMGCTVCGNTLGWAQNGLGWNWAVLGYTGLLWARPGSCCSVLGYTGQHWNEVVLVH